MNAAIPHCGLFVSYGLTEISGISLALPNELETNPTTVGQLFGGIFVKVINEKTEEKCGIGEEGEIYIKAPVQPMGYFRDPSANERAFDKEGYFVTGDIGYFDKEGRLYISGRKKEMFKVRNFVIWPTELEDVIQKNPAVRYVCVVNVYDTEIMSDLPAAVVVRNEQFTITEDAIFALIAGR